ncbi:hypothetical protein I309_06535 [Cryptococcus deuterogattii LA55]|nr:hypothetical protein I309_06535 [Cryptococcus deuterogattii LA55]KIR95810.1 hypothetical protein I304_00566 [Cryptococcus deuterogattii CBS 10090]
MSIDWSGFDKTVQQLYSHPPNTIIVPDTMLQSGPAEVRHGNQRDMNVKKRLMNRLEDEYEIECIGVDRSHWDRETGLMFIDIQTAKNLELVRNNLTNKATHTLYWQEKLTALRSKLSTVSKILHQDLAQTDVTITDHRISLLLDLMDYLQSIRSINVELAGERCKLLDMITRCLSDKQLDNVFCTVSKCLSRDATSLRKNRKHQNARIARLFAVKAGFAPLLDVARQSYQENLQDIYDFRPVFKETLAIHGGRHPILDKLLGAGDCIPNNIMSGKSTYLKQIGLLTVQAMIGCFVPAEYACFILHDSLLSRLSNDGKEQANIVVWLHLLKVVDSMEKCLSTFASEMAASALILGLASPRSLVLIDEKNKVGHGDFYVDRPT